MMHIFERDLGCLGCPYRVSDLCGQYGKMLECPDGVYRQLPECMEEKEKTE